MLAESPFLARLKSWLFHPDRLAIFGILGLLFAFYPELFLVKAAPLTGDHLEQHYPWAYQLAQSLKQFKLPFWTPLIHCGFPLVAESQVGAFYLPNLILYFCLPFKTAYSYMNLIHWFIAGWGTYAYAKQMKLGAMASFVAAVIFVFGGAYGGAYYNMTSLKTICWFPVGLYFLERYLDKRQWRFLARMAFVIGQSIVAGYLQMAALTWMIFGVYAVMRIFLCPEIQLPWTKKAWTLGALTAAAVGALILAFPQIYLTFQLAMMSNRTGLEEGYAYVGSMSPLALGTLINPGLSELLRGNNLYSGALSLFLVFFACVSPDIRSGRFFRLWGAMTLLALLLALGQWSPVYVALIKITKFYSFRVPAKFLGFICFGLAMLSALGFQGLWQGKSTQGLIKKAFRSYLFVLAFFVAFMATVNLLLTVGRGIVLKVGQYFIMQFVFSKPGHPYSLKAYFLAVEGYADSMSKYFSFSDPVNVGMLATSILCIVVTMTFLRKKNIPKYLLCIGVLFLVVDLYMASFQDEQREFLEYKKIEAPSPVLKILDNEKVAGRLGRIYGFRSQNHRLPVVPSQNMIYGIADIGAYSPLVTSCYYKTIGLWGNINDSNFAVSPTPAFVTQRLPVLGFLNVSHILSDEELIHPDLKLVFEDPQAGAFLYANRGKHGAAYFISDVKIVDDLKSMRTEFLREGFDPRKTVLLEKREGQRMGGLLLAANKVSRVTFRCVAESENRAQWEIETDQPGFFVLPNTMFPGWRAWVDGGEVPMFYADGLFQGVWIPRPGHHRVKLGFSPSFGSGIRKSGWLT